MPVLRALLLLGLLLSSSLHAITLESPLQPQSALKEAKLFTDEEGNRSVESVLADPEAFKPFDGEKVELGYTTKEVWVLFSLANESDKTLRPVLEIDNPIMDYIHLYTIDNSKVTDHQVKGVMTTSKFDGSLNFDFDLNIKKKSSKQFLLHVQSISSALYFHITVMSQKEFFLKEIRHQLILVLFFGLIIGLIVYNSFIYLFTKDITYVYYVGYQLFVLLAYASYVTINSHLLPEPWMVSVDAYLGVFYLNFVIIFMSLFTRSFLRIQRFTWLDRGIGFIIFLAIIIMVLSYICCYLIDASAYLTLFASVYLIGVSSYLYHHQKEPHAQYFVIGWGVSLFATISLMLYQMGLAPYMDTFPYLYESGIAFEAVLFSVMLARRINHVKALASALTTQKVLTRELHHRVKNNMQLIISLLQLKFADMREEKVQRRLQESINNILAMSKTHESLYTHDDLSTLDTQMYFERLLDTLRPSFGKEKVAFRLDARVSLAPDDALHCGIILNELVTNAMKYAFEGRDKGVISVRLYEKEGLMHFEIADDGIGYDPATTTEGFGLMMLHALVKGELQGDVEVDSSDGTSTHITWNH